MEQLKREEFGKLVKGMKAVYAQPTFIADKDAFDTWYLLLADIPYEYLSAAVQMHLQSSKFPPTIAELREAAAKLAPKAEELSDLEAWAVVRKALGRSGYYWEEEYAKLPKPVRKAVGHAYNLREWSQMETDTVESVIQSQFLRSYRTILSREEELRKLPKPIRDRLESRMYGLNEITAE